MTPRRSWGVGLVLVAAACGPADDSMLDVTGPAAESRLAGGGSGTVALFEDRLSQIRFYPEMGEYGALLHCQANPIEDADGNDWTAVRDGKGSLSRLVEPGGVIMIRELALGPEGYYADGSLKPLPNVYDARWTVTGVGIGHISISVWRDAAGSEIARNTNVQGVLAPLGADDEAWLDWFVGEGQPENPFHDLMNESFEPGSRADQQFQEEVAEARAARTLQRVGCDSHVWFANGQPSWIQRNDIVVR